MGQYTVLTFLPVTPNAKAIDRWNELVSKFADKPVQFFWIASEKRSDVEPFLKQHPVDIWLLIDEQRAASRAYGCDFSDVAVDPSGNIVGFTSFINPDQLTAILEGRAVAIPRDTPDDQVWKLLGGLKRNKVRLDSEPWNPPPPKSAEKPDIAPSYEVHIAPSKTKGTDGSAGPDFWVQRGFGLKAMAAIVYGREEGRVEIPAALDNGDKFDFVVVLPKEEDNPEVIYQLVQRAIEKRFAVSPVIESRPTDVYEMTAIKGKTPPLKTGPDSFGGGFASSSGFTSALPPGTPETPEAIQKAIEEMMKHPAAWGLCNVSADNTSMDDFGNMLERSLGRPVINETGLDGVYDIQVTGDARNTEDFTRNLREQAGLVLTPVTRTIEKLVMKTFN